MARRPSGPPADRPCKPPRGQGAGPWRIRPALAPKPGRPPAGESRTARQSGSPRAAGPGRTASSGTEIGRGAPRFCRAAGIGSRLPRPARRRRVRAPAATAAFLRGAGRFGRPQPPRAAPIFSTPPKAIRAGQEAGRNRPSIRLRLPPDPGSVGSRQRPRGRLPVPGEGGGHPGPRGNHARIIPCGPVPGQRRRPAPEGVLFSAQPPAERSARRPGRTAYGLRRQRPGRRQAVRPIALERAARPAGPVLAPSVPLCLLCSPLLSSRLLSRLLSTSLPAAARVGGLLGKARHRAECGRFRLFPPPLAGVFFGLPARCRGAEPAAIQKAAPAPRDRRTSAAGVLPLYGRFLKRGGARAFFRPHG